ncbi:DUF1285 domain-containing protein [Halomonas sp. Bachu 37]|uniref:DUF1285 domain-containing protein n=1 Tax=Halomonas kashgarensis TaxID=3084920 RepID=UPI0032172663
MNFDRLLGQLDAADSIPPLDQWQPALTGDMDVCITADGRWLHEGVPFSRPRLVRMLASLLRRDPEGYCLVTPVERWRIQVEDLPLIIVEADYRDGAWWLTTQLGDSVRLGREHCLSVTQTPSGEQVPQVPVRFGLAARLNRNVYYQLVEAASVRPLACGASELGVESDGVWQPLGSIDKEDTPDEAP